MLHYLRPFLSLSATNGNLSAGVNLTPRTTSTTVAPGLGHYILAALGQTSSSIGSNTTATAVLNTTVTSSSSSSIPSVRTVCYSNAPDRCFTDVFYTAPTIARTGAGSDYATSCSNALSSYSSASSSWGLRHSSVSNYTNVMGGTTWIPVTYYANATTACDGHARVHYSPAIATSSTTITTVVSSASSSVGKASVGWMFPISTPSCSINPSDCDGLWQAYSTSSSQWANAANATVPADAVFPTITASPSLPPCINSSQSSSNEAFSKSFYGCGLCTIFGDEVQLIYFPVPSTVSRDMCATTPTASVTYYDKNDGMPYSAAAPVTTWTGPGSAPETAVLGNHTFTSDGRAYISIKHVWAVDRCSSQVGTTVSGAILALPSDRLLSLRYSQDHFQYFATTSKVTGYPFNFADLNTPVPYSAWNGQARCEFPGAADYKCNVIYEDQFYPQLAMPPGIRKLQDSFEGCQFWYGGLYDPPYALKPGTAVATPTLAWDKPKETSASPSSVAAATTPTPTALADHTTGSSGSTVGQDNEATHNTQAPNTQPVNTQAKDQNTEGTIQTPTQAGEHQGGQDAQHSQTSPTYAGGDTQNNAQATQSTAGAQDTQATNHNQGSQTQDGVQNTKPAGQTNNNSGAKDSQSQAAPSPVKPRIFVFTAPPSTYTATFTSSVYVCGTNTLSVGGPAKTLPGGWVISAGAGGLVVNSGPSTVAKSASAITALPTVSKVVVVTVGTKIQTFSADSAGAVQVGTTRLSPGGSAATLADGSVVSAANNGIVVGSTVVRYSTVNPSSPDVVVFVVGTKTVTASCPPGATDEVIIGTNTITAGGAIQTLSDGSRVSLAPGGSIVVDGTTAATLQRAASAVVFTVNDTPVTAYQAAGSTDIATVDGTIISQGGSAVTLSDGEVVSMGKDGIVVQQDSSTVPLTAFTTISETSGVSSSSTSQSKSGAQSSISRTATDSTQAAGRQSTAAASTKSSNAGSIVHLTAQASLVTFFLSISPLLFAIYL